MKKLLLLLAAGSFFAAAEAQAQANIAAARAQATGTVTVRGIVTNGAELGLIRYLQDNTGGIAAYSNLLNNVKAGDSVEVTGTLKNYNNLLEIDPVSSVNVLATNLPLPAPVTFTAANAANAYAEQYEGMLVKITGNTSITTTTGGPVSVFAGNTNYRLNGVQNRDVRISSTSTGANGVVGKPVPNSSFDLIGIMSQFSSGSPTTGYQLLPRLYSDFVLGAAPNLTSALKQTNITPTGFTVTFTTKNPGDTKIEYGTTTALGQTQTLSGSTTQHSISLNGLSPATVYYVKVTSTNTNGSSSSNIVPMMTASNSTGSIKVYFNKPVATSAAFPGNTAINLGGAIDDTIVAYINRAKSTVDVMIYSFTEISIAVALNNAKARGVNVRIIYEGGNPTTVSTVNSLNSGIQKRSRNSTRGIMHNKVVIIDANAANANDPVVLTGSTNFTDNLYRDPNSIIFIQDQSLAKAYTMEFEEMWGGPAGITQFGPNKTDNTPHFFNIGGTPVELYFSPSDNVNTRIIETIGTANHDLHVATVQITRSDLAVAIRDQVTSAGILNCSEVLVDDTSNVAGPFYTLYNAMNNRIQKYNQSGQMHHKYLIADVGMPGSDPLVLVGSHNWSNNAANENDENTLIIHSHSIANQYYQEFLQRIADQNANLNMCSFTVASLAPDRQVSATAPVVYPNPNKGQFQLAFGEAKAGKAEVVIYDLTGKVVFKQVLDITDGHVNIETNNLNQGLYNLQLNTGGSIQYSKVIVY